MLALALLLAAATATVAAAMLVRRRRTRRVVLAPGRSAIPAGVHHLASSVSDLSDLGIHLHAARRNGKPRVGPLLEQR